MHENLPISFNEEFERDAVGDVFRSVVDRASGRLTNKAVVVLDDGRLPAALMRAWARHPSDRACLCQSHFCHGRGSGTP
jgi:hypothetical protein